MICRPLSSFFFFFNDTATTEIYTLSLHDALPICYQVLGGPHTFNVVWATSRFHDRNRKVLAAFVAALDQAMKEIAADRSEEHTSELQSQSNLVCRLLLEKKKRNTCERKMRVGST